MVFTDEFFKQDAKEFTIGLFEQNQLKNPSKDLGI